MAVVGSTDTLLLGDGEKNARAPLAVLLDVVTGTFPIMRGAGFERTGDLQGNSYQGDADVQTLAGRSACVRFNTREYLSFCRCTQ